MKYERGERGLSMAETLNAWFLLVIPLELNMKFIREFENWAVKDGINKSYRKMAYSLVIEENLRMQHYENIILEVQSLSSEKYPLRN